MTSSLETLEIKRISARRVLQNSQCYKNKYHSILRMEPSSKMRVATTLCRHTRCFGTTLRRKFSCSRLTATTMVCPSRESLLRCHLVLFIRPTAPLSRMLDAEAAPSWRTVLSAEVTYPARGAGCKVVLEQGVIVKRLTSTVRRCALVGHANDAAVATTNNK